MGVAQPTHGMGHSYVVTPPSHLHPISFSLSQSTSSCSESETSLPVRMALMPSRAPVVENAQQDPHWP